MVEGSSIPHPVEILDQTLQVYLRRPHAGIVEDCQLANNVRMFADAVELIAQCADQQAVFSSSSTGDQVSILVLQFDSTEPIIPPTDNNTVSKSWAYSSECEDEDN